MEFDENYSVGIAKGTDISIPIYYMYNTLSNPTVKPQISKHHKVTKIDKKKAKSKRRMIKQSRKRNR